MKIHPAVILFVTPISWVVLLENFCCAPPLAIPVPFRNGVASQVVVCLRYERLTELFTDLIHYYS